MDSATGSPGLLWFRSILPHFSFLILSILILAGSAQAAPCPLNSANLSVTICTPTNGATVTSPVNIVAGTTDSATVIAMAIYVDNNLAYKDNVSEINTNVTMSPGSHYVVVQSWDSAGNIPKTPINITVAAGGGGGPCAANPNNNTLTICTPAANTTVTSPVSVVAEATSSSPVDKFLVYVDNVLQYQQLNTSSINTSVSVSPGTHNLTVQYYNGQWIKNSENIAVASGSGGVTIGVTPTAATLQTGANQQFTATVSNTSNTAVTWAVDGLYNGNINVGTISNSGLYTAPAQSGTHTITASSQADSSKTANATVTVVSPGGACRPGQGNNTLTICSPAANSTVTSPVQVSAAANSSASVQKFLVYVDNALQYQQLNASSISTSINVSPGTHNLTVQYYNGQWIKNSVNINVSSGSGGGGCNPTATDNTLTICTPLANSTVTSPVQVVAAANSASAVQKFLVYVDNALQYQQLNTSSISTSINISPGTHNLTVQYYNGQWIKNSENITVSSDPGSSGVTISPALATVSINGTQQFSASVQNSTSQTVNWSVDGISGGSSDVGTVSSSGFYTAPATPGAHRVTAISTLTQQSATVVINVIDPTLKIVTSHNDVQRTGQNNNEVILTPSDVNQNTFGKLASYPVDGEIYGQPLYVANLTVSGVTHNLVFVATQHDSVYAFDADGRASGPVWQVSLLGPGMTPVSSNDVEGVSPEIGVLGTPVIDPATQTLYLVSMVSNAGAVQFWLHALDLTSGQEKLGGPALIQASVAGTGAESANGQVSLNGECYQRAGLVLSAGRIYIGWGHCAHGWLLAYDATTLSQVAVFNTSPNGKGATIWSSGGAPAVDSSGDLYLITGVDADSTVSTGFSNAFLKFAPDLTLLDYFIPANTGYLTENDADLGSGADMVLPDNPSATPHEVIGAGKDGRIFLLNRDHLGGFDPTSDHVIQIVQSGAQQFDNFFDTPAFWNSNIYYHAESDVLRQFTWSNGLLSSLPVATGQALFGVHGATPSISSNGNSGAIVWELQTDQWPTGPAVLHAADATNVASELYNSTQNAGRDQAGRAVKFTVPTVVNGKVYVGTANEVDIYGLLK